MEKENILQIFIQNGMEEPYEQQRWEAFGSKEIRKEKLDEYTY